MSINPVATDTAPAPPSLDTRELSSSNASVVKKTSADANLGSEPKQENSPRTPEEYSPPQLEDAVQVQRDGQDQIVIKYLDKEGRLVLQVPSSQVLGLQKAIERALEDQESRPAPQQATVPRMEGTKNGY